METFWVVDEADIIEPVRARCLPEAVAAHSSAVVARSRARATKIVQARKRCLADWRAVVEAAKEETR